jgi:hypothetical protein
MVRDVDEFEKEALRKSALEVFRGWDAILMQ